MDSTQALLDTALDLTKGLAADNRNQRLIDSVMRVVPADAVAILALDGNVLVPLAHAGFGRGFDRCRFAIEDHPRLAKIVRSDDVVRFDADDPTADPYDGLIASQQAPLDVHACMGAPLRVDGELIGALTVDAHEPGRFDDVPTDLISTFSALAAAAARIAQLLRQLEDRAAHERQVALDLTEAARRAAGGELLGESEPMRALREELLVVGPSELSVLVLGETGTGKELVARVLHAQSSRADRPMVSFNCAALASSLADSELFGHEKGAFTGAVRSRPGKFELADGGTLFLDEVGELPVDIQPKLLRALQFGEVERVGGDRPRRIDTRIIAATNRNLAQDVKEGRFRADLYHRLAVYPIHVPPLRTRRGDVPLLVRHVLAQEAGLSRDALSFSKSVEQLLDQHSWRGNVRELEHVVLRAALRARAEASKQVLPRHLDVSDDRRVMVSTSSTRLAVAPLREATETFQRELIQRTHEQEGTWAATAKALGVDRSNLVRLAKRLRIRTGG